MKKGKKAKKSKYSLFPNICDSYGNAKLCNKKDCYCFIGEEERGKKKEGKGRDYQDRKVL